MREPERVRYVSFVTARYAALYRTAYLLTGNHHTAEDVVQTALAKVYVAWGRVEAADRPEAYVRRILVNEVVSLHRHRWTREVSSAQPADLPGAAAQAGPEEAVVDTEVVWQGLARLTTRQRAVIVLRYYEDLNESEIAAVLGIAPGTVKGHARAALRALRATLPAGHGSLSGGESV